MSDAGRHEDRLAGAASATDERLVEQAIRETSEEVLRVQREMGRVVIGQDPVVRQLLVAVLAGGHVLLEGVPGLGKTLLVRSLATVLGLDFSRVQCTPDLIPADVTGTNILLESASGERRLRFQPGPVFSQMVLVDEINRATPKTQSAFLEAMEERQVTIQGERHLLPRPFIVLGTQNPIEMEGTFPLPEAQLDRFTFKVHIGYPDERHLLAIGRETTGPERPEPERRLSDVALLSIQRLARRIPLATELLEAAVRLVRSTHPGDARATEEVTRFVRIGASPRALQALILGSRVGALLDGRCHVSPADLREAALPALRHRVLLNFEADAAGIEKDRLLGDLADRFLR